MTVFGIVNRKTKIIIPRWILVIIVKKYRIVQELPHTGNDFLQL